MINKFKKNVIFLITLSQFFCGVVATSAMEPKNSNNHEISQENQMSLLINPVLSELDYQALVSSFTSQFDDRTSYEAKDKIGRYFETSNNNCFNIDKKYTLYILKDGTDSVAYAITQESLDMCDKLECITLEYLWVKEQKRGYGSTLLLYLINLSASNNYRLVVCSLETATGFYNKFMEFDGYTVAMPLFINNVDYSEKILKTMDNKYKQRLNKLTVIGNK